MGIIVNEEKIIDLNTFIHQSNDRFEYHMAHIKLAAEYAKILNHRLGNELDDDKLVLAGLSHDTFKERSLDPSKTDVKWNDIDIPQDTNRYVRHNLNILEDYGLADYFNTDVQLHPLSAGIFLKSSLGIDDPEILYPIFFHSCPIIPVYETLPEKTRTAVDIMMLADKLSSNYLRIHMLDVAVRVDLELIVFGPSGKEFNYTMGLLLARMIAQDKSKEKNSIDSTEYYYKRLLEMNPFIPNSHKIKRLGGKNTWQKRKSPVLPTELSFLKMS